MAADRLGVGFIGSGFNALFHLRSWVGIRDADVLGFWSPTASKREALDRRWRGTIAEIIRDGQAAGEFTDVDADDFLSGKAMLAAGVHLPRVSRQQYGAGKLVPLSTFASLETTTEPRDLRKFQQLNAVRIQGVIPPGVSLDQALSFLEEMLQHVPDDHLVEKLIGVGCFSQDRSDANPGTGVGSGCGVSRYQLR